MSDELDLEKGDPGRSDSAKERRRRRSESAGTGTSSTRAEAKVESEVRSQVTRAFEGLAKNRYTHEDIELGDAIAEESDAMTEGFVTLTTNLPVMRMPVVVLLNIIITLLAFGRVGGILLYRLQMRRAQKQAESAGEYIPDGPIVEDR